MQREKENKHVIILYQTVISTYLNFRMVRIALKLLKEKAIKKAKRSISRHL
jgi:hypothetical protein